ncbi:LysR family transcriptional regulator [Lichenibacterium minor]|uniref:LysR family transcriptional regulator n=1 Tax=Lichenibacterium minor TaxID=2316528 RepID=A0A4Q2U334_9HYPH|nr:LysR family transcriptional regulator [Lichenibacterium minor]
MELRHIRYFVAVAEEANFTRAAARLGIGQPPLSQQIKDLEREIGAALFRRVPRGAELTAAGQAFLDEARAVLAGADRAVRAAQRAARGEQGRLRLGFTGSAPYNPMVTGAVRAFRDAFPDVAVELFENNTAMLLDALDGHAIDAAFVRPGPSDRHRPSLLRVDDEALLAVLSTAHPLAGAESLALADLAADDLVTFPRAAGPELHRLVMSACRAAGFEPRIGQEAPQIASVVNLVAAGFGFSLVPASIRQVGVVGVSYRSLGADGPRAPLSLAWRTDDRSPVVAHFLRLARERIRAA